MCKEQLGNVLLSAFEFSFTECPSSPYTQKYVILRLVTAIYEKLLQFHEVPRDKKGYVSSPSPSTTTSPTRPVWLDLMIPVGPFQLRIFYDSDLKGFNCLSVAPSMISSTIFPGARARPAGLFLGSHFMSFL